MKRSQQNHAIERNVRLYPWFKLCHNMMFWQSIWFLYFQQELSAAAAITLFAIYDISTTVMEVPSGYFSDRLGRRITLILSAVTGVLGAVLIAVGDGFAIFAVAQICLGANAAFASGTDSSLLYESLVAEGREEEMEAQSARGWQFTLWGLALSALSGGFLASFAHEWAFVATACAFAMALFLTLRMREPPHALSSPAQQGLVGQWAFMRDAFRQPVLVWLFLLSVLLYAFGHVLFVFGQPFIAEALALAGRSVEVPIVSGVVSAAMMIVSVMAAYRALWLRQRVGLPGILLLAFSLQIILIGILALTNSIFAVALLLLRMVPSSLSNPFITARIQPLLSDAGRATYLSLQSFASRVLLSISLLIAAERMPRNDEMTYADMQVTLIAYVVLGVICFAMLLTATRFIRVER